jgi:lysophospholipase L1-like esterase
LCEKFSFKYAFDLAKGGAHWSILKDRSSSDNKDNDIIRQINILKDLVDNSDFPDPELILIHCGQNDISPFYLGHTDFTMVDAEDVFDYTDSDYQDWSSWMLTDVADATSGKYRTNSVAGGMRITIETIRSYWPLCKIVITTPIQIAASGGNVGWAMDGYYWQIVKNMTEAAYRLSVPIIDLARESGMSKTNLSLFKTDGVHLSATGGKRIADIIGRYLISHYGYKNWW